MPISADRLKLLGPWLRDANNSTVALLWIILSLVVALGPLSSELVIRWTGMLLQLLGVGTVIWGISETELPPKFRLPRVT